MKKMIKRMCLSVLALMVAAGSLIGSYGIEAHADDALPQERILLDDDAGEMQEYAAKELQKYLYQLFGTWLPIMDLDADTDVSHAFVLGTKEDAASLKPIEAEIESIGEQGYVLKKSEDTLYIGGHDDAGLLYGVYGLLDDHYGIGFYFSGDVIPEEQGEFYMPEVDEAKTPRQYMRGILPWTNFPQSSTVYSLEDWKYVIDQMARMRMNFLNIHNYNGQNGHNEMFHNFTYDGITSRNWNATAGSGHGWYGPAWDVNEYRFGASDLFDDYDFGMDATLHNDSLSNTEVFAKGYSMFQYIIQYAHSRGVKIGLGLDIDLVMPDYGVSADAPGLPELQAETVMANYEDLDTLILYISEMIVSDPAALSRWRDCFDRMYETVRAKRPDMQIAVSGWGISEEIARSLPDDVVIAPISNYSAGFVNGSEAYPGKEYWGGPWVERDFDSSVYYYPYNMELSDTVKAYQENKDTMQGLFTLTWRLSDAVDPKIMYIAKAPWDSEEKYQSAEDVYREYAQKCYGQENAEDMGKLLYADEKTVVPTTWSECNDTVQFTGADREADIARVQQMIDRVEQAMQRTDDRGNQARLDKLRNRLIGVQAYCRLDQGFNTTDWAHLQDDFATWARSFINRIDDISSLGNIVSTQNRFVQLRYVARETQLRNEQEIKAPLNVSAEGTADGAQISWEYEQNQADGFYVYRDGERISPLLSGSVRTYADVYDQAASYTVRAVNAQGQEGEASIAQTCLAGSGDQEAPQVFVVSPPTSVIEGQDLQVKARVLDGRVDACISAQIHYRPMGSEEAFVSEPMERRVKSVFTASLDTAGFANTGIEYYITVSDGDIQSVWPATAPQLNAVCTVSEDPQGAHAVKAPMEITAENGEISWSAAEGDVFWYRIYRSDDPDFEPSMANFITYVEGNTTQFSDVDRDIDGSKLSDQTMYYKVTAVDDQLNESIPTQAVEVRGRDIDPLRTTLFADADALNNSSVSAQSGSLSGQVVGFTRAGGHAMFEQLRFSPERGYDAVEISYSSETAGSSLAVWIDAPDAGSGGTKLGEATLGGTGAWDSFATAIIPLDIPMRGTHDVYFVYGTGGGYFYNLDTFRFTCTQDTSADAVTLTPNDLMADRRSLGSGMKEELSQISGFGSEGDRIVLGTGYRAGAENTSMAGGTTLVDLPGYPGLKCYANIRYGGQSFTFSDLSAGKAYFAYDKAYAGAEHQLALYVNEEKHSDLMLPDSTGSDWNNADHKIMYADTGITLEEGDSLKFAFEHVADDNWLLNGVKLFVEQPYSGEQINIEYANQEDTQFSVYVNGQKEETIILPDSDGQRAVFSLVKHVDQDIIALAVDAEDAEVNAGASAVIYQIDLLKEAQRTTRTISVSHNAGGSVTPDGEWEVDYGASQTIAIQPDPGYRISSVVVNDVDHGAISSYTFERLTYDADVQVTFEAVPQEDVFDITLAQSEHGSVTASHSSASAGQPIQLSVQPETGYHLKQGSLVYVSASHPEGAAINAASLQFTMPREPITIQAVFEPDVSKAALKELVGEAKQLDEGSYTADSWSMLMRALEEAECILAAEGATQDEVDAAEEKLSLALDALVRIGGKTELNALIEKAEAYLEGEYTAESIAVLRAAIDAAKIVADDADAAAEEVSEAITNLSSAIAGLEKLRLDTSALEHEIELVSEMIASLDDYVPSSVEGLADKLAAAKETLMNAAEQSALDEATARLREARLMARTKADISALEALIGQVNSLDLHAYTKASAQRVIFLEAQAKQLISDPEASQADVDEAAAKLQDAIDALQPEHGEGAAADAADTSVENVTSMLIGLFITAAGAVLIMRKRRS